MPNKRPDHIDKHKEWQDHQFNPGHFTGGKIPGWLHSTSRPKFLGLSFVIAGLTYLGLTIYNTIQLFQSSNIENIISVVVSSLISLLVLAAGIKLLRKKQNHA